MTSLLLASLFSASVLATRPPNLVLVVADDLGIGDLGCYGGTRVPTPNIDAIATDGVRFTDAYTVCPLCAPSRAGLITGRYPQRFGFEYNPAPATGYGVPRNVKNLAERLRSMGYATAAVGKWHLGEVDGQTPLDRGFQSFYGFYGGGSRYLPQVPSGLDMIRGKTPVKETRYLTTAFTSEAVDFVNHSYTRPFFLYLSYNAVHKPYQAPQMYLDRFPLLSGEEQIYAAMVSAMDDGVGRLRSALKAKSLYQNTVFVFVSDNGGNITTGWSVNGPYRGGKNTMFEGGLRVPYIVSWPGYLPQGSLFTKQSSTLDLAPTFMAAAGSPVPAAEKLDGVDLVPYLTGVKTGVPHPNLYWRMGKEKAIRSGSWKYLATDRTPGRIYTEFVFNLSVNPQETWNVLSKQPTKTQELKSLWESWSSTLQSPAWPPG